MIKQFFKIGGVKNEKEFLAKYPTEASFFRKHPEAMALVEQSTPYMPSYSDMVMPQAMYGMGMAYGGYVPFAQNGMEVTNPPKQQDYPDYESFSQAMEQYLTGLQQQADGSQGMPQGNIIPSGSPVSAPSPYVPTDTPSVRDYSGPSVVDFLIAQGMPADFASRKDLASSIGITNYRGTATQNKQLMQALQQSPDIVSMYAGAMQPTGAVTKAAVKGKNAKGAPSTESIAAAKQKALGNPDYETLPEVRINAKSAYKTLPGMSVYSRRPSALQRAIQANNQSNSKVRRNISTGAWEAVPDPAGMMTVEYASRIKMAQQLNAAEAAEASGQPIFRQEKGGQWNGTWNGNQGFEVGGSYLPDYASSAYGLPQFELGAPMYAEGGMSPEEAMMMQQQGPAPEQGGAGMDQQQIVQAVMQMMQQGMDPNQIMQQLVQSGVPPQMAEQVIMMVMQQVQGGGGPAGGQGGMGGGQPNGMQQPMAPPSPEQGMEGMPMPGGMAKGGMVPGWEGEVTMAQLEDLKRRGIKFDII